MSSEGRRTQAVRAPGASGFTPPTSVAASNPCLNCGTNVQLSYCPECGQREIDPDPTLREFLDELAEEFLHWDGKLVRTFRALVSRPGALTCEYLEGRRVRYVSPLRVYLACSVIFFALSAIAPRHVSYDRAGRPVEAGIIQATPSTPQELAALDARAQASHGLRRVWLTHMARALRSPRELQHSASASIPRGMFVLVPLFAAIVGFVYRDRRRKYPQHLVFALHVHSALFLALTITLAAAFLPWPAARIAFEALVFLPLAAYVIRATARVYNSSPAQSRWRMSVAAAIYFAAFTVVLTAIFALTVLTY